MATAAIGARLLQFKCEEQKVHHSSSGVWRTEQYAAWRQRCGRTDYLQGHGSMGQLLRSEKRGLAAAAHHETHFAIEYGQKPSPPKVVLDSKAGRTPRRANFQPNNAINLFAYNVHPSRPKFLQYDRESGEKGMWRLKPSEILPDENAIRAMIKPEEVSLLDAMQLGIKELEDAGYDPRNANIDDDVMDMDAEEDDEDEGGSKAPKGAKKPGEKQEETLADKMAPWKTTKAFIDACAQKAMLQLHGEGDPTGHGLGFSFIRTSMKGGYIEAVQGPLATSADAMEREKRANGGHAYNVKKQQAMYEEGIKEIWEKQKATLSDAREHDDKDVAVTEDEDDRFNVHAAATPAQFDDGTSQISGFTSASRHVKKAIRITREVRLQDGSTQTRTEVVHDPVVISQYMKRRTEADLELKEALHKWACLGHTHLGPKRRQVPSPGAVADYVGLELRAPAYVYLSTASTAPGLRAMPTMTALRALARCRIKKELERLEKNKARRQAREQQKELHQKASAGEAVDVWPMAHPYSTLPNSEWLFLFRLTAMRACWSWETTVRYGTTDDSSGPCARPIQMHGDDAEKAKNMGTESLTPGSRG
ncbi:transcription factor TFIID complex subunit Taf111 [Metarhizium album ARSEF 1941]|uniref:Transcription factor TFIID complex subunit Taf111 n=1 Tax=Metarhizium album (strain ARSEF 1941) TaxID=1081103 RepID=A0A0B2WLF5_METAS|nr:transcription factor TFIID complex subunit Taf111 [Metarhizium album ARSEF 1941]KHN93850.1 transcription factor TFIID complex subunit Taf111 [Metarhizium album ARSEF 1941]